MESRGGGSLFCRCCFVGKCLYLNFSWIGTGWFYPKMLSPF